MMQIRVDEVDVTLSALVVGDTRTQGSMWHFGQHLAQQHSSVYEAHQLSPETLAYFEEMSKSHCSNNSNSSKIAASVLLII